MKQIYLLMLILLMIPSTLAEDTVISSQCAGVEPYEYDKLAECQLDTYAQSTNKIISDSNDVLISEVYRATQSGMTTEQAKEAQPFYNIFRYLFVPFFLMVIIYSGYRYMGSSAFPEKRAESKKQLQSIMIITILISALPFIINTSYDIANSVNAYIMDKTLDESYFFLDSFKETEGTGVVQSVERLSNLQSTAPSLIAGARYYLISMQARNLILLFLISISPIILLLFFFIPTREYGKIFTYLFFIELIIPVMYMIIFKFSTILAPGGPLVEQQVQKIFALTSALFLNVALHLVLILVSIFKASFDVKPRLVQDV